MGGYTVRKFLFRAEPRRPPRMKLRHDESMLEEPQKVEVTDKYSTSTTESH
jgi:hypothetical protein